jgi:hypothetical protein
MIGVELPTAANQPCLSRRHKRAARHVHRIKLDLTFRRDQAVELCVAEEPLPVVPIPILTHPMIFPRRAEIVRKATAHPCGDAFAAQKGAQQECEIAAGSDCSFTGWPWDLEGSPVLFENVVQPLGNRQRGARRCDNRRSWAHPRAAWHPLTERDGDDYRPRLGTVETGLVFNSGRSASVRTERHRSYIFALTIASIRPASLFFTFPTRALTGHITLGDASVLRHLDRGDQLSRLAENLRRRGA